MLEVDEQELTDIVLNHNTKNIEIPMDDNMISIDIIDAVACCGGGIENSSENIVGKYQMSTQELSLITFAPAFSIKMLKVEGDSMIPTLNPGDMVLVDTTHNYPMGDGLYVLRIGDKLMVKRIQINPMDNSIKIKSDNSGYEVLTADNFRNAVTIGQVIYIYKVQKVG